MDEYISIALAANSGVCISDNKNDDIIYLLMLCFMLNIVRSNY